MFWRTFFVLATLLGAAISSGAAGDNSKVSVFVNHAGNDRIGQHTAELLENLIKSSPDYKIAPSHEAMMKVTLASLNPDVGKSGDRSAISTVITMRNYLNYNPADPQTWYPIFLSSSLVVISASRADELASETLAKIDATLERYREDVRKYQ